MRFLKLLLVLFTFYLKIVYEMRAGRADFWRFFTFIYIIAFSAYPNYIR